MGWDILLSNASYFELLFSLIHQDALCSSHLLNAPRGAASHPRCRGSARDKGHKGLLLPNPQTILRWLDPAAFLWQCQSDAKIP